MTLSTPSAGRDPALSAVTRRSLLRASPALLAPCILAGPVLADADTPAMRLFREWEEIEGRAHDVSDEECDALMDASSQIERRIVAEPITCLADLAAKVVASSGYGDFAVARSIVAECEAILAGGAA